MKTGAETSQTSETMQERELTAIRQIASVDKMDGQHSTSMKQNRLAEHRDESQEWPGLAGDPAGLGKASTIQALTNSHGGKLFADGLQSVANGMPTKSSAGSSK